MILGPGDQFVFIANSKNINTPNSSTVKVRQQNDAMTAQTQAQSRRLGLKPYQPPPLAPLLVSPILDPVEAVKVMTPQFSALSEFNHGPSFTVDRIIATHDASTVLEGGKAADITYELTYRSNAGAVRFRTQMDLQIAPLGAEAWLWLSKGFSAPVDIFDRDQPLMAAMFKSIKLDPEKLQKAAAARNHLTQLFTAEWVAQYQANMQASAQQFTIDQAQRNANWQAQHQATLDGYAQHNAQVAADLLQRSRNFDDQIDQVRGFMPIVDTHTGQTANVNSLYADTIVNSLNEAANDPNQFAKVPLKDIVDPLPGR